jgi:hypothetical protein
VVDFRIGPVYSRERTPVRNEEEAVCATKPAQSFWRREKSPGPANFVSHYRSFVLYPCEMKCVVVVVVITGPIYIYMEFPEEQLQDLYFS